MNLYLEKNKSSISIIDLYKRTNLVKLDQEFLFFLSNNNKELASLLRKKRQNKEANFDSDFTLKLAPYLEQFLSKLFHLDLKESKQQIAKLNDLLEFKKNVIQRTILRKYKLEDLTDFDEKVIERKYSNLFNNFTDLGFYDLWQNTTEENILELEKYIAFACLNQAGKKKFDNNILFKFHNKINKDNLTNIPNEEDKLALNKYSVDDSSLKIRDEKDAFNLTDTSNNLAKSQLETNTCLYCHEREKDSCRKGLYDKNNNIQKSITDIELKGCPLDEKISEMNLLRQNGFIVGSLATAMIDNPFLAATGHRICNDCMKACIFQMQEPVNIPQIESNNLDEILNLPYGFEIYSLLTRWNPLKIKDYLPRQNSKKKILIVGFGPAGFNLALHLLNSGHIVVAIDGLKIEPLDPHISGLSANGKRTDFLAIKNTKAELFTELDKRTPTGFGGVAEYGITVRWNKNYLNLIRVILERNSNFRLYGSTRYGSQITRENAFNELGFDHIALCQGSGSPNIIPLKNNLVTGIRKASDFLMSLQLTGAFLKDTFANLQIRLPVIVVGGGLTAFDTATEALAYYPRQVLNFKRRFEQLDPQNQQNFLKSLQTDEFEIFKEFMSHSELYINAQIAAKQQGKEVNYAAISRKIGGVKIIYRKRLHDSPAYRLNHEEVTHALKEGIEFYENISPKEAITDQDGRIKEIICSKNDNSETKLSAKTLLIAAGTKPNIISSKEDNALNTESNYLAKIPEDVAAAHHISNRFLTYIDEQKQAISFFGDLHPEYHGNVVKAMASSKDGYKDINQLLENKEVKKNYNIFHKLNRELLANVVEVKELTTNIVEVIIKAPLAAKQFKPGQFYRLQNYTNYAAEQNNKKLVMEGIALTGSSVNLKQGTISLIALEMGGSSNFCRHLKRGEPVALMGPTGAPTELPKNQNVMLVGGGLGNAVLFSIGKALKATGSKVLYFAGYKKASDRYKLQEIRKAADVLVFACDEKYEHKINRRNEYFYHGNIIEAMQSYHRDNKSNIKLTDIDHIIAIGSEQMMSAIKQARHQILKSYLKENHTAIASINSPMQCMMKEICAQCLQKHIDPITKKESFVYSCANQDQEIDKVSFENLRQRLKQNSLQEKLLKSWLSSKQSS